MKSQPILIFALATLGVLIGVLGVANVIPTSVLGAIMILIAIGAGVFVWQVFSAQNADIEEYNLQYKSREENALALRAMRERERAFYEMTTTLSSTLNPQKVLEAVQNIGDLISRNREGRISSAAFLFDEKSQGNLQIAYSRGLSRRDEEHVTPGEKGVLGLALKQSEPVFAGAAKDDPELQYYTGFQQCQSILALPLWAGYRLFGVLVFGNTQPKAFSEEYSELLIAISTQATIALQNAELYQDILQEKERIVEVEEDARKKLSRDLHDGPTQSVAAIAMRLNYVKRLVEKQEGANALTELTKIEDIARSTTKEIRHMLFTLRPLVLENQGLVAALNQMAEKKRDTYDLNVLIEAKPNAENLLDRNAQGVVFYIIEEAITNARKHAQSTHIWVRLYQHDRYFVMEVQDDGVGFDDSAIKSGKERNSLGMTNMNERAALIEGILEINSKEGVGTNIRVLVPVPEAVLANQRPDTGTINPNRKMSKLREISATQTNAKRPNMRLTGQPPSN